MRIEECRFIILTLWARLLDAGFLRSSALCRQSTRILAADWSLMTADNWRQHLEPCLSRQKNWTDLRREWDQWLNSVAYRKEIQNSHEQGIRAIHFKEKLYPKVFLELDDPPPVIFVKGCLSLLKEEEWTLDCVTVVGSRRPTSYGERYALKLGERLAAAGLKVVSGLAYGIDAIAQNAAVYRGGTCVAVLASPLNRVYPRAHQQLSSKIERQGLLMTERAPGAELKTYHFPMRNRLMSALGRCCVVLEAGRLSGSLITARLSLEQGKDIWALPGRIDCSVSQGCNYLIENGAYPLNDLDVFMDWLFTQGIGGKPLNTASGAAPILSTDMPEKQFEEAAFQKLSQSFGPELPQRLLACLAEGDQSAESLSPRLQISADRLFALLAESEELGLLSFVQGAYRRLV